MKVWIAWSGKTSQEVAAILKSWLVTMNPHIEAFFSSKNIAPGTNWIEELHRNVFECDCALFCLTSDNIHSPWLYYEAGVLHNTKNIIPVLFDVPAYQLDGPFIQFQALTFEKENLWKIVNFLNGLCGQDAVPAKELRGKFETLYPTVEKMLALVRDSQQERLQENQSGQSAGDNFATLNSKLDAILSRLPNPVPSPRQENSL